jgi:hypothetical protein
MNIFAKTITMNLKESVKLKVDQLDQRDLRIVYLLIDSLAGRKKTGKIKRNAQQNYYEEVIQLLGKSGLTSNEIIAGREERI